MEVILYDMINNSVSERKVFFVHGGVDFGRKRTNPRNY